MIIFINWIYHITSEKNCSQSDVCITSASTHQSHLPYFAVNTLISSYAVQCNKKPRAHCAKLWMKRVNITDESTHIRHCIAVSKMYALFIIYLLCTAWLSAMYVFIYFFHSQYEVCACCIWRLYFEAKNRDETQIDRNRSKCVTISIFFFSQFRLDFNFFHWFYYYIMRCWDHKWMRSIEESICLILSELSENETKQIVHTLLCSGWSRVIVWLNQICGIVTELM